MYIDNKLNFVNIMFIIVGVNDVHCWTGHNNRSNAFPLNLTTLYISVRSRHSKTLRNINLLQTIHPPRCVFILEIHLFAMSRLLRSSSFLSLVRNNLKTALPKAFQLTFSYRMILVEVWLIDTDGPILYDRPKIKFTKNNQVSITLPTLISNLGLF